MSVLSKNYNAIIRVLREWRIPEVRLLFLALCIAVMSVSSISFFTDRVNRAMSHQGTILLGADMLVSSSRPISEKVKHLTQPYQTTAVVEFRSVMLSAGDSLLTEVKAVGDLYPLRGSIEISKEMAEPGLAASGIPAPGEAWAAAEVFHQLGLTPGSNIQLGNSMFKLSRVITLEMDAGGSIFRFAPRLMINLASLPDTGLITPASRAEFKWLIAGTAEKIKQLRPLIVAQLGTAETLRTIDDGRPEISAALKRAIRFMKLASVLTIIIAGAAIALAVLSYTTRERLSIAVYKTLGATRRKLWRHYLLRFTLLVVAATTLGSLMGYAAQQVLSGLLSGWLNIALPAASALPLLAGLTTALLTLAGFALPSMIAVIKTPPMRILRAGAHPQKDVAWMSVASIGLAMAVFLLWQAGDIPLAAVVFFGVLLTLLVMLFISTLLTRAFATIRVRQGQSWRLGLVNIGRYGGRASLLITSIGTGIFALSLLGGVRGDLLEAWQNNIPENAPNHFLINIQTQDLEPLKQFLESRKISDFQLFPMIRGRLRAINGQAISAADFKDHQAKDTLKRELNLSTTLSLPAENKIVEGQWFDKLTQADKGISVEAEIAQRLGIQLDDELRFDIGGQSFIGRVSSLRQVQWDNLKPNFYVIAPPEALKNYTTSHITAVHITAEDKHFTGDLVKQFPAITVLDVRAILSQLQRIIGQVSSAVEVVFAFSLLAGIVVLLAAIQTQRNDRRQEIAILKTLGASQRQIRHSVATEFITLGMLAGLIGAGLALLTGWILAEQVFDLNYQISWMPLIWGLLSGVVCLGAVGYWVIHQLIHTPPRQLLQEI